MRGGLISIAAALAVLVVAACSNPYGDESHDAGLVVADQTATPTEPAPPSPDPAPTPTPTPTPVVKPVPGGGGDAGGADAAANDPANCPSSLPGTIGAWKPPPAVASVCSGEDMTYFTQVSGTQTWLGIESLMRMRNAACASCIFSKENDALWRPVVYVGTEGDAIVNYGSCFARAAGGTEACGRGLDEWSSCYASVCSSAACGAQAALDACYQTQTVSDACAAYNPTTTKCGGSTQYAALNNTCISYIEVARVLCAAGN
jgi:hypothetical protein